MATTKKKECGYKLPKTGKPCGRTAKYGTAGAPRCKSHEGKRNKRGGNGPRPKLKKGKKSKAIRRKGAKVVSKRGSAAKKTRKTKKTAKVKAKKTTKAKTKTKAGKKKKRAHTAAKISFYDVKTGKNIMVPRDNCKIKRNKSSRGGDRIICMHKGRKFSTFVARGFKL